VVKRPPYSGRQLVGFCLLYVAGSQHLMSTTDNRWVQAVEAIVVAVGALGVVVLVSRYLSRH
jgi:hypothetical protein